MHGKIVRVEVKNTGGSVAKGAYGKITVDHEPTDVLSAGVPTFITPESEGMRKIEREYVSWAVTPEARKIDLPVGGEPEMLMIVKLEHKDMPANEPNQSRRVAYFEIPSESGFHNPSNVESKSRATLAVRRYEGSIVVGADEVAPIQRDFVLLEQDEKPVLQLR